MEELKPGPPAVELDKKQFQGMCQVMCTKAEIASIFGVSEATLERWVERAYDAGFAVVSHRYRSQGAQSLRRAQFRMAIGETLQVPTGKKDKEGKDVLKTIVKSPVPAMAIWLGKQYLGQTDKIEHSALPVDRPTHVEFVMLPMQSNKLPQDYDDVPINDSVEVAPDEG